RESLLQVHLAGTAAVDLPALKDRLESLLVEVRRAVEDWQPMLDRLQAVIDDYRTGAQPVSGEDETETIAFLEWLADGNFTFLGVREYDFVGGARSGELRRADIPGLGILRDPDMRV